MQVRLINIYNWYKPPKKVNPPQSQNNHFEEKDEDFSMDIDDELLTALNTYCDSQKVNKLEDLDKMVKLLKEINQQKNNSKHSQRLQIAIIETIRQYQLNKIINPYIALVNTLKNPLTDKELDDVDRLCDELLGYCQTLAQANQSILDVLDEFTTERNDAVNTIEIARSYSDQGTDINPPETGFYYCKNKIKAKRVENKVEVIRTDVDNICKQVQVQETEHNYQGLRQSRDDIGKEAKKLEELVKQAPIKQKPVVKKIINEVKQQEKIITDDMFIAQTIVATAPAVVKDKTLDAIKKALKVTDSYVTLIKYQQDASPEKKSVFPRFLSAIENATSLDDLLSLIVEGYQPKSKKPIADDDEFKKVNKLMIRNTGCGFCGLFGLFYQSTTHRYLMQVATDLQNIVNQQFGVTTHANKRHL